MREIVAAAVVIATIAACNRNRAELPIVGEVPAFHLVGNDGRPLSRDDLSGKVWVADFIYTQCPGICPVLSSQMQRVQAALKRSNQEQVRLVSFSVDPAHDTPEVLREYAQRFSADPQRWWFVTGERAALHQLIGTGFQLAVAERSEAENTDGQGLITHSDRFVLIDQKQRIRGYYHGSDPESVDQLIADIARLKQ